VLQLSLNWELLISLYLPTLKLREAAARAREARLTTTNNKNNSRGKDPIENLCILCSIYLLLSLSFSLSFRLNVNKYIYLDINKAIHLSLFHPLYLFLSSFYILFPPIMQLLPVEPSSLTLPAISAFWLSLYILFFYMSIFLFTIFSICLNNYRFISDIVLLHFK